MSAFLRAGAVSWKTTLLGVLLFIDALTTQLIAVFDASPDTVADWNLVVITGMAMLGMWFAKDADKTSEDHKGTK